MAWGGSKRSQQGVQILSWSLLAEPGKQGSHRGSFVHKDADVALGFGEPHGLRKCTEGLLLLVKHLVSQSLQDLHFDDVAPAFLLLCDDLQRFQEGKGLRGALLGQQDANSCHLLAFTSKWRRYTG